MRKTALSSSTGTKVLIAVTGLALFAFLILHLAGNLLVFAGPKTFNGYSESLNATPLPTILDLGLLAIVLVHIWKTVANLVANRQARPVGYHKREWAGKPSRKTLASTTMILSGIIVIAFLIIHLRHFKFGGIHEHAGGLYALEMELFSSPLMVAFYVLAMVVIGFHLWHGIWSSLNSLGVNESRYSAQFLRASKVIAALISGGFALIPLWAYFVGRGQ
jgi:succinate dehydrogenase / fumarate reductase cytochrome b subunit